MTQAAVDQYNAAISAGFGTNEGSEGSEGRQGILQWTIAE